MLGIDTAVKGSANFGKPVKFDEAVITAEKKIAEIVFPKGKKKRNIKW